jgi:hypothetical protein
MLIYETDTNRVAVYDTNDWVYKTPASTTGSVLQVVSTAKTDVFTTTSTTMADVTGLSVTVTPKFASSKIFISANFSARTTINCNAAARLLRDSTAIGVGDAVGSRVQSTTGALVSQPASFVAPMQFLDSPNTTSATTYKVQVQVSAGTLGIGSQGDDSNSAALTRFISTITVMEIAG